MAPAVRKRWIYVGGAVVLAVVAVALAVRLLPGFLKAPSADTITASGRIEGRDVAIAPKDIQGRVRTLLVDEGDTVRKGQLLAELEANALDARAASLAAAVANIDAQIEQASLDVKLAAKNSDAAVAGGEAAVSAARARLVRAKAVTANAGANHRRALRLFNDGVISGHEFDQIELALRASEADADAAAKDLGRAEAELVQARASKDTIALKQRHVRALEASRRAAVAQIAELDSSLAERRILAPSDGTILSRPVEVGDVVGPGTPMFVLVDLARLYVKVYIPEREVARIKLGDTAEVSVDAFPDRTFPARVSRIHEQAEFTPKNVETAEERLKLVFGVEVALVNPERLLKPGMPVDCVIHVDGS